LKSRIRGVHLACETDSRNSVLRDHGLELALYGVGLGFYATPSTYAAMSSGSGDKAGAAAGIYNRVLTRIGLRRRHLRNDLHSGPACAAESRAPNLPGPPGQCLDALRR